MKTNLKDGSTLKCRSNLLCVVLVLQTCAFVITVYALLNFYRGENVYTALTVARSKNGTTSKNSTAMPDRDYEKVLDLNITSIGKKRVIIFVGIISAPRLIFRRNALRASWVKQCEKKGIPCLFFTDGQDMHGNELPLHLQIPLHQEQLLHGDMILAESPGGINFARRYLWMLNWANARYKFEYFLRIDDDYFVCMDRLLFELPHRPREKLYWGYVHCSPAGGIRVDEGFVIVSNDLAQQFLREQNKTLMCHAYGDQAMAMWINNIPGVTYFGDPRVHHAVAARDHILQYYKDICGKFLAIHGSYPVEIEKFWLQALSTGTKKNYTIPPITYPCGAMNKTFNYMSFLGRYNAKPKLCRDNPTWSKAAFYKGRSGR